MRTVTVDLGPRAYDVHVGAGILGRLGDLLPETPGASRIVLFADEAALAIYGSSVESQLRGRAEVSTIPFPSGEQSKSIDTVERALEEMAGLRIRRDDLLCTLGGGVASDLGGFVASIYQRGIPVAHLPTTLLAQVDAAVGGKTGVNLPAGKNLAGSFHQPVVVLADSATLESLPERDLRSGLAEVAKCGLIFDEELLRILETEVPSIMRRDVTLFEEIVVRCVSVKAHLVSIDELDRADRVLLNYGHTLGHALESASGYEGLHGEAVAVGMVFAAELSEELGIAPAGTAEMHRELMQRLGLPVEAGFEVDRVMSRLEMDKKYSGGPRWVLFKAVGEPVVYGDADYETVRKALDRVRKR